MSKVFSPCIERVLFNPLKEEILDILKEAVCFINGTRNKVRLLDSNLFGEDWVDSVLNTKSGSKWTHGGGIRGSGYGRFTFMAKSSALMIAWFTHRKIKKVIIKGARVYISTNGYVLSPIARSSPYELVFPERFLKFHEHRRDKVMRILDKIGIIDRGGGLISDLPLDILGTDFYGMKVNGYTHNMAFIKFFDLGRNHIYGTYVKHKLKKALIIMLVEGEKLAYPISLKFVEPKYKFYHKYSLEERLEMAKQRVLENLLR